MKHQRRKTYESFVGFLHQSFMGDEGGVNAKPQTVAPCLSVNLY